MKKPRPAPALRTGGTVACDGVRYRVDTIYKSGRLLCTALETLGDIYIGRQYELQRKDVTPYRHPRPFFKRTEISTPINPWRTRSD